MAEIRTFSRTCAAAVLLCSLIPSRASAEDRAAAVEASRHFERGYLMAQQGSLEQAIREFESAYALQPHASVLYNLGQAYAASGRAAQAVQTLRKYLEQSDPKTDAERRAQAAALLDYQNQRVGALSVEVDPPGAELILDGVSLGRAPLAQPVPVTAGVHGLTVSAAGRVARHLRLEIAGKQTLQERIELEPNAASSRSIFCAVPDVTVLADGARVGALEQGGRVAIPAGTAQLSFERPGFKTVTVPLPDDPATPVDCGMGIVAAGATVVPVRLEAPSEVVVNVNGLPFRGSALPSGRHVVAVSGRGVEPAERLVEVSPGPARRLTVASHEPAPSLIDERMNRRRWHLYSAIASAGIGAVGLGVAGVLYAVNRDAYSTWRSEGTELARRTSRMPGSVSATEWNELLERENILRNRDSVALGSALIGGACLLAGGALWLTAPQSPTRTITLHIGEVSWLGYSRNF